MNAPIEYQLKFPEFAEYQLDAFFGPHRFLACDASTKIGKTFCSAVWQLGHVTDHSKPDSIHWWIAPKHKQAGIAYKRVKRWLRDLIKLKVFKTNESLPRTITYLPTNSVWVFDTGEDPDNLYGDEVDSLVLDEASRCRAETWDTLLSVTGPRKAPVRMVGNVKNRHNWNYKLCRAVEEDQRLPMEERVFPEWKYARITIWDAVNAGIFDGDEARRIKAQLERRGHLAIWNRDYLADPEGTGTGYTASELDDVTKASPVAGGQVVMTVDPGGKRNPAGIVVTRCGRRDGELALEVLYAEHWYGAPTALESRIYELKAQFGAVAVVTDNAQPHLTDSLAKRFGKEHVHHPVGTQARMWGWYNASKDLIESGGLRINEDTCAPLLADMAEIALDPDKPDTVLIPTYEVEEFDDDAGEVVKRPIHCDAFDGWVRLFSVAGRYATHRVDYSAVAARAPGGRVVGV